MIFTTVNVLDGAILIVSLVWEVNKSKLSYQLLREYRTDLLNFVIFFSFTFIQSISSPKKLFSLQLTIILLNITFFLQTFVIQHIEMFQTHLVIDKHLKDKKLCHQNLIHFKPNQVFLTLHFIVKYLQCILSGVYMVLVCTYWLLTE